MRALLGVLRSDGRAPQPTLAQLGALLDAARAGGRVVDLDVEGERRALPGGVELTAYRIVEHALEGQDGAPLAVRLRYRPDRLELELRGAPETALAAARERVGAHGGASRCRRPAWCGRACRWWRMRRATTATAGVARA